MKAPIEMNEMNGTEEKIMNALECGGDDFIVAVENGADWLDGQGPRPVIEDQATGRKFHISFEEVL